MIRHTIISITLLLQIINIFADQVQAPEYNVVLPDLESSHESRDVFFEFRQPINFTRQGIKHYLRNVYNRSDYCTEFLPHSFCHCIEFLEYGKKTGQEPAYMQSAFRLFINKIKGTRYITAYAFSDMIGRLPDLVGNHFKEEKSSLMASSKDRIVNLFYDNFLSHFSLFKKDPKTFLDDLATEVLVVIEGSDMIQTQVDREQLKQTIMRFLELSLDKVIWAPVDQMDIWESVKTIAQQMAALKEQKIINQEDLDDLYKSLLERFCHFLDLAGSELSLEVVQKIKEDIATGNLLFLELEEQEDFMETKSERLTRSIVTTEAKVRARSYGIITEIRAY